MTSIHNRRGPHPGIKHASHLKKDDIKDFVKFCLRGDIANELENVIRPHQVAVKLYENETGIKIPQTTAYKQRGRWRIINGELCEIRKVKDFVAPPKPPKRSKTPKGLISFAPPISDQKEDSITS